MRKSSSRCEMVSEQRASHRGPPPAPASTPLPPAPGSQQDPRPHQQEYGHLLL